MTLKVFACSSGQHLALPVCKQLGIRLGKALVGRYNDGEVRVQVLENVRGRDCFIIGSTHPPAENILEVILLSDALRSSSAGRVTLVLPYLGYNRMDRKDRPRVSVSAAVINSTLARQSRANRILLFDVHSEATLGVFHDNGMIVDHLYTSAVCIDYLKSKMRGRFKVASPDKGGTARARAFKRLLGGKGLVVFDKDRPEPGEVDENTTLIIGEVHGYNLLQVDDILDTAGTVIANAKAANRAGARRQIAFVAHPLLSKNAVQKLDQSDLDEVIITDSIHHPPEELRTKRVKITVLSMAPLMARAIGRIHREKSLSPLIL